MGTTTRNLLPIVLLAVAVSAAADDRSAQLDALLSRYNALRELTCAAHVADGDEVLLARGYGLANMELGVANTAATPFRIGSISKSLTAVLVVRLAEQGRLSLDSHVAEVLPWYRQDTGSRFTVRQLLSHTSGLPSFGGWSSIRPAPTRDFVTRHCSGDLEFEPGSEFRYSNGGYVLLAAVVEQATGKSYEQALRDELLAPLGMTSTGLDRPARLLPGRASPYQRTTDGYRNVAALDPTIALSAGGLYSTVTDLGAFARVLEGRALLSPASHTQLTTPVRSGYALGVRVDSRPLGPGGAKRTVLWHGGRIEGFNSLLVVVPEDRRVVVLLHNADSTRLETIAHDLLEVLYGRSPSPPRAAFAEEIAVALRAGTPATDAVASLRARRAAEGELLDPEPEEMGLNFLGYDLLGAGRTADAVTVLAFAAELFPRSWNAHDSLGEALAAAGRTAEAVASYRASLELNPGNRHATDELARLAPPPAPAR